MLTRDFHDDARGLLHRPPKGLLGGPLLRRGLVARNGGTAGHRDPVGLCRCDARKAQQHAHHRHGGNKRNDRVFYC